MERESFCSPEVAHLLNSSFIPIKVDREERPDVDAIYMNYVQATTGSGGWPLNVFLTPDLEPVFGGTYWPGPDNGLRRSETLGFMDILKKMRDVWTKQEGRCRESAEEITRQLREFAEEGVHSHQVGEKNDGDGLEIELLEEAYQNFARRYDIINGGFSRAPKFPTPVNLSFLLRLGQWPSAVKDVVGQKECAHATKMAVHTLCRMARGGIRDQIGYGFSRYSVTSDWSLPHFEKMLYDQAQLLDVYLNAFLITHDPEMLGAVYDIATYLTSPPISAPGGGFYCAEDADSYPTKADTEKREGAFYIWSLKEFQNVLGDHDADICARFYGVTADGNVAKENDPHDEFISQNVLNIKSTPSALAKEFGLAEEDIFTILREGRKRLRDHRERERPPPALDDKILVAWNGLAIGALARTSAALASIDPAKAKECRTTAENAVAFARRELYDQKSHTLWRVYRQGRGDAPGFCDDYAFLIQGLIDLYEATFDDSYLQLADNLQSLFPSPSPSQPPSSTNTPTESQLRLFLSPDSPGFYTTPSPHPPDLLLRLKSGMDAAEPSSNNISASNLYRLASMLEDEGYRTRAKETVQAFEAEVEQFPWCFAGMLGSVVVGRLGGKGVVVTGLQTNAGETEKGTAADVVEKLREKVGVGRTVVALGQGVGEWVKERNLLLKDLDVEKEAVMVCEGGTCRLGEEFL